MARSDFSFSILCVSAIRKWMRKGSSIIPII